MQFVLYHSSSNAFQMNNSVESFISASQFVIGNVRPRCPYVAVHNIDDFKTDIYSIYSTALAVCPVVRGVLETPLCIIIIKN